MRPPVVSEAEMALALSDGGQIARETACVYSISKVAQLGSAPPNWRTYLVRTGSDQVGQPTPCSPAPTRRFNTGTNMLRRDGLRASASGRDFSERPWPAAARHHRHGSLPGAGAGRGRRQSSRRHKTADRRRRRNRTASRRQDHHHHLAARPPGKHRAWRGAHRCPK